MHAFICEIDSLNQNCFYDIRIEFRIEFDTLLHDQIKIFKIFVNWINLVDLFSNHAIKITKCVCFCNSLYVLDFIILAKKG